MDPLQGLWRIESLDEVREAARRTLRKQSRDEAMPKYECARCGGFLGRYRLLDTKAGPVPFPPAVVGGPRWPANGSSVRLEPFQPPSGEPQYYVRVRCSGCKRDEKVPLGDFAPPVV